MGSIRVSAPAPAFDGERRVPQGQEPVRMEARVAQAAGEALDVAVPDRLPRLDEVQGDVLAMGQPNYPRPLRDAARNGVPHRGVGPRPAIPDRPGGLRLCASESAVAAHRLDGVAEHDAVYVGVLFDGLRRANCRFGARATATANRSAPRTGCGGHPFSRIKRRVRDECPHPIATLLRAGLLH